MANMFYHFRCSVFLVEKETEELVAKVFDGDVRKNESGEIQPVRLVRVTTAHTASRVASTGHYVSLICFYI